MFLFLILSKNTFLGAAGSGSCCCAGAGKHSLDAAAARLSPVRSNDDSVMSQQSNVSSTTSRRRRSSARRSFSRSMGGGEGRDVIWVNGRPLAMPTAAAQNFTSPPQQSTNLNNPTQGFTGNDDAINFSLPKHIQNAMGSGESPSADELQELAANAPTPHKFTSVTANPLLDQIKPLPRSGQGPAWHAHGGVSTDPVVAEESVSQPKGAHTEEDPAQTVTAGLGAKFKAQLAALRAETAPQQEVEMTTASQGQSQPPTEPEQTAQQAEAQHQKPYGIGLVSPPDSVQGDDADSDPGASASEMTWSAGMGQDLGRQLQARLAGARKPPGIAKPPVHRGKPTSEQTWSAGMGAGMGAQLRQQLAQLRAAGRKDAGSSAEAAQGLSRPSAGPRDADKFPAQPTRVPWTAPVPESNEQTWTDSLGRRMRQQLAGIRGLGSDSSVPLPTAQQRPSVFDLFADQPFQDKPTWSAGIGEKMRRQLEEMRKRDVEDSAHTASTSSQDQELAKSPRRFNATSLPNTLPSSEQTWTAGMGNAAKRELLQRRSIMKRNNSSPDIEQEGKAEPLSKSGSKSKLQTAEERDESSRGGKEYLHQDSLDFHHLEEIPHVSYCCFDAVASVNHFLAISLTF